MKTKLINADPQCFDRVVREFQLDSFPVLIGRGDCAGLRLEDPSVSNCHCELDAIDGTLVVRDLNSQHGTYRNGAPVQRAVLMPGDILTVGSTSFVASYNRTNCSSPPQLEDHPALPSRADDRLRIEWPAREHFEHLLVEDMRRDGISSAVIYAFEQTGLLVTDENQHLMTPQDLERWDRAIEQHDRRQGWPEGMEFPIGMVAFYGPDDAITTKILAAVVLDPQSEPLLKRWIGSRVKQNDRIQHEVQRFLLQHEVRAVIATDGNVGCVHEEGVDFPIGEDCPFCPYWKGKQGSIFGEF